MRWLATTMHRPNRAPNQRFRFEQYIDYLSAHGVEVDESWLLSAQDDKTFYGSGHLREKAIIGAKTLAKRLYEVRPGLSRRYRGVFVCREAFFAGPAFIERIVKQSGARMIYDFDDSIWVPHISETNKRFAFLKDTGKIADAIRMADLVIAGNRYLADYAEQYNGNVTIVPTTIDTDEYVHGHKVKTTGPVCIGWSGSVTTIQHFEFAVSALRRIKKKYGDRVTFKVVGDGKFRHAELGIVGLPWKHDTEIADLSSMDIGIMPLPNDEWAKGKCGLKGLQYMAVGVPTVMSPVGVNTEIIQDGVDGYLADDEDEWVEKLSRLIEDADLRKRLGAAARATVESRYSVRAWRERYVDLFRRTENGLPACGAVPPGAGEARRSSKQATNARV